MTQVRGGGIGDLYCRITVETPVNLTKRQREILEEFAEISDHKQSPQHMAGSRA